VSFLVLVFVRAIFCHGALKHDMSTLFTKFFVWLSLQFIIFLLRKYAWSRRKGGGWNLAYYVLSIFSIWFCFLITYINFVSLVVNPSCLILNQKVITQQPKVWTNSFNMMQKNTMPAMPEKPRTRTSYSTFQPSFLLFIAM